MDIRLLFTDRVTVEWETDSIHTHEDWYELLFDGKPVYVTRVVGATAEQLLEDGRQVVADKLRRLLDDA